MAENDDSSKFLPKHESRTKLASSLIATWTAWCCESWPVKVKWGWTWPGSSWLGWSAAPANGGTASSQLTAPVNNKPGRLSQWIDHWVNLVTIHVFTEILPSYCLNLFMLLIINNNIVHQRSGDNQKLYLFKRYKTVSVCLVKYGSNDKAKGYSLMDYYN